MFFFAVTSPLKERAFLSADSCDKKSKEFKTANTLIWESQLWKAFNTDWHGLRKLKKYSLKKTVVWGGGGVRPVLKQHLPQAHFYSARTGKEILFEGDHSFCIDKLTDSKTVNQMDYSNQSFSPDILIWAVGRKRMAQGCLMPPPHWKPSQVIDINYTEDSPGLEYAQKVQAQYRNGMEIFKEQAKKQRDIFKKIRISNST